MAARVMKTLVALVATSGVTAAAAEAKAPSLRGSPAAMQEQNQVAKEHGLTFYRTAQEIREGVARGDLVHLAGNADYDVADFVSNPYAHPAAKLFVERLSQQYRAACGQKLVVTSALRAGDSQPRNAHALSVHPAGMALDLRVSDVAACRSWLENALMTMESQGLLNGIRERTPPHYHVALYPEPYLAYAAARMAEEAAAAPVAEASTDEVTEAATQAAPEIVAGGDSSSLPKTPLMATLALLVALPLALRCGWLRADLLGQVLRRDTAEQEQAAVVTESDASRH
jgi:hypothetical protein